MADNKNRKSDTNREGRETERTGIPYNAKPARSIPMRFRHHRRADDVDEPFRRDLSACALVGRTLWLANDETARIERLTTDDWRYFGNHRSILVADFFDLPSGPTEEIDIEGLAAADGYLWVVGSHSWTRKKPKRHEKDANEALARLSDLKHHPNRYVLGRIPLADVDNNGLAEIRLSARDTVGTPRRHAGCLKTKKGRNALVKSLCKDDHLARFMSVPCKENGLDVEGIAVRGDRVFLGLRGPVLRGWAIILELRVKAPKEGRLKLRKLDGKRRHRKHFVDLDGLGIRDMEPDGDDLLILAGPTMDLDGPIAVYRWPDALAGRDHPDVITHDRLELVRTVPFGDGMDHAEGLAVCRRHGEPPMLLVVFDSPAPSRLHDDGKTIDADLFTMTEARGSGRKKA